MTTETEKFLHEQHLSEIGKMPPVLMGVASAAIGFAFHETADRSLDWSLAPILAAVLLWGASFAFGVLRSRHSASLIKANIGLNWATRNNFEPGKDEGQKLFDAANNRVVFANAAQQWLLLLGAAAYLAGHVWFLIDR
jgi:hypothetical protein